MKIRFRMGRLVRRSRALAVGRTIQQRLFKRGGPVSSTWAKHGRPRWHRLAKYTKLEKIRLGYKPIADNKRTGALKRASMAPGYVSMSDRMTVFRIPPDQNQYAGFINNGTGKMPARPFYDVKDKEWEVIATAVAAEILRANGFDATEEA